VEESGMVLALVLAAVLEAALVELLGAASGAL